MKLSESELEMVEVLRKKNQQWKWARWMCLFLAAGDLIVTNHLWRCLLDVSGRSDPLLFATIVPFLVLNLAVAGFLVGFALSQWKGNPTSVLLVKLIDELEKKE